MKYFGTVKSFDAIKGLGEIKPETGGDVGTTKERQPCALNLATI